MGPKTGAPPQRVNRLAPVKTAGGKNNLAFLVKSTYMKMNLDTVFMHSKIGSETLFLD